MKSSHTKKLNEQAREYIRAHPDCTHAELVKSIHHPELSKGYFYAMRSALKKRGTSPTSKNNLHNPIGRKSSAPHSSKTPDRSLMTVEILESINATGFSEELVGHFKTHFFPLLKKLTPDGPRLQMAFLSDPPTLEIRRLVS